MRNVDGFVFHNHGMKVLLSCVVLNWESQETHNKEQCKQCLGNHRVGTGCPCYRVRAGCSCCSMLFERNLRVPYLFNQSNNLTLTCLVAYILGQVIDSRDRRASTK